MMSTTPPVVSSIIRRTARRRWWLLAAGAAGLFLFDVAAPGDLRWDILAEYAGLGSAATLGAASLARRGFRGTGVVLASALLDLVLTAIPAALTGGVGLGLLPLVAMLPYAESEEGTLSAAAILAAGGGLLLAHALTDQRSGWPAAGAVAEACLVTIIGFGLRAGDRRRAHRLDALRRAAAQAVGGDLSARLDQGIPDALGEVERGFDRLAARTSHANSTLAREANEVAALAEELAASVDHLEQSASELSDAAGRLALDLQAQRVLAEESRSQTEGAAQEAGQQRQRALVLADESTRLVTVADRARQSVAKASETLVAVGNEVSSSAKVVDGLTAMSARIGGFTQTISAIARQTHLLSLNAAIEAARAEGEGQGFGVVAEEVRTLAAQAGRSAREVSDLVTELQEGIGDAARAMNAGQQQVEDVARVAGEAEDGLRDLTEGVRRSADRVGTLAGGSRTQSEYLQSLRGALEQVSKTSQGAATSSDSAARAATQQTQAVQELARTAQQLAGLAERLRAAVNK
jgi:methyl-accepting chemotaxis protein